MKGGLKIRPYKGLVVGHRLSPAEKPPLPKGRWHGISRDGGIYRSVRSDMLLYSIIIPQSESKPASFLSDSPL